MRRRLVCTTANGLWLAGCLGEAARFRGATSRVAGEQEQVLSRILHANANTEFGREHGFSGIRSVREFQRRVPLRRYDDFVPWIDRMAGGSVNVLTRAPVRLFEPTSGSTGATKLIPCTAPLRQEFQRAIRPWIADLFTRDPHLMSGTAYWSVSPVAGVPQATAGGVRIGFDADTEYVGSIQRRLVDRVMAAPASLRLVPDLERWRYLTALALVNRGDLTIISVWHPAFLSLLLARIEEWGDMLLRDLQGDSVRARAVRSALRAGTAAERHVRLWPSLRLVSCWADGNAAAPAAALQELLPQARMQAKGLMATEAFVSFPKMPHEGGVLAVRSHFLEFAPVGSAAAAPRLAGELEAGCRYSVIVTTGGGLYRYRLEDVVEVIGHVNQCPIVRFAGRGEYVSDWFGEKLTEAFTGEVLRAALGAHGVAASFAMLACEPALVPAAYVLYIETSAPDAALCRLAATVDRDLRRTFHYDYARRLGQLGAVRPFRARGAAAAYVLEAVRRGQRAGSVKPLALDRRSGWARVFAGDFVGSGIPFPATF